LQTATAARHRVPITIGVMVASFMSALDTTVVNVALPHMQGSLSASPEQVAWIITSYIVATAVIMPLSGWLAARLGVKRLLLFCVAGFTLSSFLCGVAGSLPEMVACRLLQGVLAAPLWPLAQAVLLNINPPERASRAMALFSMSTVAAPVVGPIVGGYLTEELSWRWCFYINLPTGVAALFLLWWFLPREATQRPRFDFLGYGALAITVASFQLLLDRGPSLDWFQSREICCEAMLAAGGLWVYLVHTLTTDHPLFSPALARDRNFVASTVFGIGYNLVLYCSFFMLPLIMQEVMGYSVIHSGLLSTPRGVIVIVILQLMGRVDALVDRRLLVAVGLAILVAAFWMMSKFDLSMTGKDIVWATALQGVGQAIIAVPIATLGFATIQPALRAEASAISNLLRSLGGSAGVAIMQALTSYNTQSMHASLGAQIRLENPVVRAGLPDFLWPGTSSGALALNAFISRQATMVAYVDDFRLMALTALLCAPLILLLRSRPAAAPRVAGPASRPHPGRDGAGARQARPAEAVSHDLV
jgi:DHA2 family multidrug resistance protein